MPIKLVPPRPDKKTQNYSGRGTYLGVYVDQSTGTADVRLAKKIIAKWRTEIERGLLAPKKRDLGSTFLAAAVAYMQAGGERKFLGPILKAWGEKPIEDVSQVAIDALAEQLYPRAPASTKNRQVYTPISAVLKHVGIERKVKRPLGWRGNKRTFWLEPEPTFRLLDAAYEINAEFGLFCSLLNYCGLRLSEGLALRCDDVQLTREYAYVPDTKTGQPRALYLPPVLVAELANHPRGLDRPGRVFRFHNGGRLRDMLSEACRRAGVTLPERTAFHVFRHNYGTWMRVYGGLDGIGLTRTGTWSDLESVERYSHSEASAEARRASLLPTRGQLVDRGRKVG